MVLTPRPNGCPRCRRSLHYCIELDEQLCLECNWAQGIEFTNDWLPEHLYSISEWHVLNGMLYKQLKARQISNTDYNYILDQMGITWHTIQ